MRPMRKLLKLSVMVLARTAGLLVRRAADNRAETKPAVNTAIIISPRMKMPTDQMVFRECVFPKTSRPSMTSMTPIRTSMKPIVPMMGRAPRTVPMTRSRRPFLVRSTIFFLS